jgi:F-type H+-transporting ATPase subunit epsilon
MPNIKVKIITPERIVFEADADSITLPTQSGEITVLPNHIPLITVLKAGELIVREGGKEEAMAVSRGAAEISSKEVSVLVDTAERVEEIEEKRAEEAREEAKKVLEGKKMDEEEYATALAKFEKEAARLKVLKKHRTRRGTSYTSEDHQ